MSRQSRQIESTHVDRKTAAEILSISQRTLDRYIKSRKINFDKSNGRIWLALEDILRLKSQTECQILDKINGEERVHAHLNDHFDESKYGIITHRQSRQDLSTHLSTLSTLTSTNFEQNEGVQKVLHNENMNQSTDVQNFLHMFMQQSTPIVNLSSLSPEFSILQEKHGQIKGEGAVYQKLYEQLKDELAYERTRVEAAHYKIGLMEAQISTMISLPEYKKKREEMTKENRLLKIELDRRAIIMKKVSNRLKSEKLNKLVFAVLVFALLALQPIFWVLSR